MYPLMGSLKGSIRIAKGFRGLRFKRPCAQIVYTVQPKFGYRDIQGVIANYCLQGLGSQVNIIS